MCRKANKQLLKLSALLKLSEKKAPGPRSEIQGTRECLVLSPRSYWRSSCGTEIQGNTFAIILHIWTQPWCTYSPRSDSEGSGRNLLMNRVMIRFCPHLNLRPFYLGSVYWYRFLPSVPSVSQAVKITGSSAKRSRVSCTSQRSPGAFFQPILTRQST